MPIRFGTDGWRAVISEEFTFDNVRRVAQAIAHFLRETTGGRDPVAVVGFDTRFLSDRYAIEVARVLAGNGITVHLTNSDAPTPAVSFAVKRLRADGGVMITASHNPPRYNGVKLKAAYGGSAPGDDCRRVETYTESLHELNMMDFEAAQSRGLIRRFDAAEAYLAHLDTLLDRSIVAARPGRLIVDPMYGAGRGYIARWLAGSGWETIEIRSELNPGFGSIHPEPIRKYLDATVEALTAANGAARARAFAVITDGDADRIGAIDEAGAFVDPQRIFALALLYLVEQRGWRGSVVKTVSTTLMLDRICRAFDLTLHETPVGFNYIADRMLSEEVLIGGEESGGISIKGHIPEGDGILFGALLAEIVARRGASLRDLVADLQAKYGPSHYARRDLRLKRPVSKKDMTAKLVDGAPGSIAGTTVRAVSSLDGVKYLLADDSWLLIRPSGTEPVLRVYAESSEPKTVEALLSYGEGVAQSA
jgi:alpha-D-glucose phosphate-specific phosphoglucomutase